ncbi:spindle and kinetochore-associated protein 1 [Camelus ferus]|nr:spindle and kinetochore-associated protein 1 [Camelus ferus]
MEAESSQEPTLKTILNKIGDEIIVVNELLNKLESEIEYQEQTSNSLKELCESLEEDYKDVEHLKENIPPHLPPVTVTQNFFVSDYPVFLVTYARNHLSSMLTSFFILLSLRKMFPPSFLRNSDNYLYVCASLLCSVSGSDLDPEEPVKVEEPAPTKKPLKEQRNIKEMPFITSDDFSGVPAYMKSRLTYCQINDVIKEINKAVVSKYKILHQPKKSMNSVARNLYHRFIDEETKETKDVENNCPEGLHYQPGITELGFEFGRSSL